MPSSAASLGMLRESIPPASASATATRIARCLVTGSLGSDATTAATRVFEGVFLAVRAIALLVGFADTNFLAYTIAMAGLGIGIGIGSLFFCVALHRSRLVPQLLAVWGFVGYASFAAGSFLELAGVAGAGLLSTVPGGLFEIFFAIWLIARGFAAKGAHVVFVVRDEKKGRDAAATVSGSTEVRPLDLADLGSVRGFAESWSGGIQLLNNNAGVLVPPLGHTKDGFELQFGINHLGHFALTNLLLPSITGRVVTVARTAHRSGTIDFDELNWPTRRYGGGSGA